MAQSLVERIRQRKPWTEKQLAAVEKWYGNAKEREAQKAAQKEREQTPCAVSKKFVELFGLFETAKSNMKAKPILRADEQAAAVESVALNPLEAALRYGRITGSCSACGRELTNHKSVEDGIGPICRDKWGF